MSPIHVWAAGINTPLRYLDRDGRLKEGDRHADQTYGQNNWHVSLDFSNFANLADSLGGGKFDLPSFVCGNDFFDCGPIEDIQIARLGIVAHGAPGAIDIDAVAGSPDLQAGSTDPTFMNQMTLPRYAADFAKIERVLQPRAKVLFACCLTGKGVEGEEFLKAVSLMWAAKEVMVYAFRSVLYTSTRQKISGSGATAHYPGARETHYSNVNKGNFIRGYETLAEWNDLSVLPWASETSLHAIMAYKGFILKSGAEPHLP